MLGLTQLEIAESARRTKLGIERRLGAGERASELSPADAESEVSPESEEDKHGDDLGDQTNDHDLDTSI